MPVGGTSDTWQLIPSPCTNDNCCTPSRESIRFLINNEPKLNGLQKTEILLLIRKFKDAKPPTHCLTVLFQIFQQTVVQSYNYPNQSQCIEVAQGDIFMERKMRFELVGNTEKKIGSDNF